jgi:HK97 family phage portal protein
MPSPFRIVLDYLRGTDLKAVPMPQGANLAVPTPGAPTGYGWLSQPGMQGVFSTSAWDWDDYDADGNSAVFACLLTLADAHIEPPLKVLRQLDPEQDPTWLAASPLQVLLDDPNPWHNNLELWWWTQYARHCDGNAYLRKVRAGDETSGNVIELWPISPRLCEPITLDGSKNFIDYYDYTYAPGKTEKIPTENIVHFRIGVDDRDMRKGLAPIKRLIRLIASDEEAVRFADALLHNFGVPGLVVQVPQDTPINEDAALDIKARLQTTFGTENRGNVGVLTGGASMQQFGFSPQDLNLEILHNVPEARIAAVMRVPPAVAGLGVGLDQTANFASLKAVYEAFTERVLVPTWRMDAAKLNKQLKPDFTRERNTSIVHDLSRVRALQDDVDAQYRRLDMAVQHYWIRPSEARIDVGKPADPELDALWLERATSAPAAGAGFAASAAAKALPESKDDAQSLEDFPELVQTMLDAAAPGLQKRLDGYFDDQRKRVKRALLSNG